MRRRRRKGRICSSSAPRSPSLTSCSARSERGSRPGRSSPMSAAPNDQALALAGTGFLDTTRVAGGDGGLWRDILADNRDNVNDSVARLRATLEHLLKLLDPSQRDALAAWLDQAAARRAKLLAEKLKEL